MTAHEPEVSTRGAGTPGQQPPAGPERALTPGGRRPLDRALILREAVRFIDAHGRDRLTMRRLGAVLGVEAMALYRYVPGRDQLLDGVVETVMDELHGLTLERERPGSWQGFLHQAAHGVRTTALRHPRIFPLVATRPAAAPWLRPPLRSLRWVEAFLHELRRYGFSSHASIVVYRAFSTFLLGHLLLESATHVDDPRSDAAAARGPAPADGLAAYPLVAELAPELARDTFDEEFEHALARLVEEILVGLR
ncbi:TetR/AcrR family transcriptional regulator C-terminal domain-containing protein [Microlunatus lacustris]